MTNRAVDLPEIASEHTLDDGSVVVCFEVGWTVRPTEEARTAEERVFNILRAIPKDDLDLMREWGGFVSMQCMTPKFVRPQGITDEMRQAYIAAAQNAYPQLSVISSWEVQGADCVKEFSVKMGKGDAKG